MEFKKEWAHISIWSGFGQEGEILVWHGRDYPETGYLKYCSVQELRGSIPLTGNSIAHFMLVSVATHAKGWWDTCRQPSKQKMERGASTGAEGRLCTLMCRDNGHLNGTPENRHVGTVNRASVVLNPPILPSYSEIETISMSILKLAWRNYTLIW